MIDVKKVLISSFLLGCSWTGFSMTEEEQMAMYELPQETKEIYEEQFERGTDEAFEAVDELQVVLVVDYSGSNMVRDEHPIDPSKVRGMLTVKKEELSPRLPEQHKISMSGDYWRRWDSVFFIAKNMYDAMKEIDDDGEIPCYFFGNTVHKEVINSKFKMLRAFKDKKVSPTNLEQTDLYAALKQAIWDHKDAIDSNKKVLFVVLTDGQPFTSYMGKEAQERGIEQLIYNELSTKDPNGERLNVFFVRVGDDKGAKEFLARIDDLDEDKAGPAVGKNVDTKSDNWVHKHGPKVSLANAITEEYEKMPGFEITEELE